MGFYLLDNPNPYGDHFYRSRVSTLRVIVLHITAGLEDIDLIGPDASAEQTARYCATTDREVSWHAGADSDSHLHLLPPAYTAWHASDYNSLSWGLEISKRDTSWSDEPKAWVEATLKNAAAACRPIAKGYNIPHQLLTRAQVDDGMSGFTYHMWLDPTRRSDPGADFPIDRFFELLREDDMANFTPAHARTLDMLGRIFEADNPSTPKLETGWVRNQINETNSQVGAVLSQVKELRAEVKALAGDLDTVGSIWGTDGQVVNPLPGATSNRTWKAGKTLEHIVRQLAAITEKLEKS